jgi:2-dehydro-3-deoxygluconokinase
MSKVITFGEIMLRLATPDYLRFSQATTLSATFGGGEANVAVSLANYGVDVEFVTRLPKNDIAAACVGELRKYGVGVNNIVYGGERLGIYFLETGAVARPSKVVYDRAHSSISTIEKGMIDWEKVFEGADWFHWTGITPAISASAAEVCLEACQAANRLGVTVSCDLNFRKNLWKYGKTAAEVMPALVECCDVILGNEEDGVAFELELREEREVVRRAVSSLSPPERELIELRYGLGGGNELTQKEVADLLGISQSYISRLEKRILGRLRDEIADKI